VSRFLLAVSFGLASFFWSVGCKAEMLPPLIAAGANYIHEFDLSPDGTMLLWAAEANNLKKLYRRDLAGSEVTVFPFVAGLKTPHWAGDNRHIYVLADQAGDEKYHVLVFDAWVPKAPPVDLTPFPGKTALLIDTNKADGTALVAINLASPDAFGVYRVRPSGGKPELVDEPAPGRLNWISNAKGEYFGRVTMTKDGSIRVETRVHGQSKWQGFTVSGARWRSGEEVRGLTEPLPDNSAWFLVRDALDTMTPQRLDLATGKMLESLQPESSDTLMAIYDVEGKPILTQSVPGYPSIRIFDREFGRLLGNVPLPVHSFLKESSSDITTTRYILAFMAESGEENLVFLDRKAGTAQVLFHQGAQATPDVLPRTVPVTIAARDQLNLQAYLTLPPGKEPRGLPLLMMVHGGPWMRDVWGYDAEVAYMALQGYAVLRVNFRGSGGFGRNFENAGAGEWGGKMQDDLTDSACWAVASGVADPKKLAIMGGSYGGYAAIWALVKTPHLFAAAIEQDGPADLPAMLDEMQPFSQPFKPIMLAYMGAERARQWERSPLVHIDAIERPLLGVQGVNDPRVRVSQLQKLEKAMRLKNKEITTLYFSDEGHGVAHEQSFFSFMQATTKFLQDNLQTHVSMPDEYCHH
jgi:dienelactone hydrolase